MSRRRSSPRFFTDGVLLVDKPAGPTSHDVVERLRRRYRPDKLGHAGTLDPFATGLLVLAFNQATRLAELLGSGAKLYQASLGLGRSTDTGDLTGETLREAPVPELAAAQVSEALAALEGPRMQAPPAYSAAKHEGRPLYAYARAGVKVEKPPRPITVYEAQLVSLAPGEISFRMLCSRGTYVRALGEDLARSLGSEGHLTALRRLGSAPFAAEEALDLDQALDLGPEELALRLLPLPEVLDRLGLPVAEVDADTAWSLRQGRILARETLLAHTRGQHQDGQPFQVRDDQDGLVAVLRWLGPGERRPQRDYDNIRVFPEASGEASGEDQTSASAHGAE